MHNEYKKQSNFDTHDASHAAKCPMQQLYFKHNAQYCQKRVVMNTS